jgi:uncharacterized protein with von Willebrand factor type A (vWA) domain
MAASSPSKQALPGSVAGGPGGNGEDGSAVGATMRTRLAGFVRTLRDNGFAVGPAETRDALAILASPLAGRRSTLQPALRGLLSATRSDWERFDGIFAAYWTGHGMRYRHTVSTSAGGARSLDRQRAPTGTDSSQPPGMPDHTRRGEGPGDEQ